jgi:hypothetical protein
MQTVLPLSQLLQSTVILTLSAAWTRGASHLFELLSEHEELHLVVDGQDTGSGNTTEDVGTGTLEERLDTLLGDDLAGGIERGLVLDGLIFLLVERFSNGEGAVWLTSPEVIIMRRRTVSSG